MWFAVGVSKVIRGHERSTGNITLVCNELARVRARPGRRLLLENKIEGEFVPLALSVLRRSPFQVQIVLPSKSAQARAPQAQPRTPGPTFDEHLFNRRLGPRTSSHPTLPPAGQPGP